MAAKNAAAADLRVSMVIEKTGRKLRQIDTRAMFSPSGIALIGASRRPGSVGAAILKNLIAAGGPARIVAVNPQPIVEDGIIWCDDAANLPMTCELAILCVPAAAVIDVIDQLGRQGTRIAVVISAGITEGNGLRARMLATAAVHGMRIIGPNCLGLLMPRAGINASFAQCNARAGGLAFLSQSGALATAMLDWADARSIGFSAVLSVGDMADVDLGDLIDLFADDDETSAILLYVEGITDAPKFLAAARKASKIKPVIAIKAGRCAAAGKAALSHTGALAGAYDVYQAAFAQAGIILVDTLDELFDAAAILGSVSRIAGDRLAVVTNGGGGGILAVDALDAVGGRLATLSAAIVGKLDAVLPAGWSGANPVDIIGDANADRYSAAIDIVLSDPAVDAVLVINCPTALAPPHEAVAAVVGSVRQARERGLVKPVLGCWLGDHNVAGARSDLAGARIPLFDTPAAAVRGFSYLVQAEVSRGYSTLLPAPPAADKRVTQARLLLAAVRADGRTLLSEIEAKRLLALFGIPVVPTILAASPDAVREACRTITAPYVVKIVSVDISHKSDFGGVVLGLPDAEAAHAAANAIEARVRAGWPQARIDGFAVQPMIRRRQAHEVFVGIACDPTFGTMLMFGAGGTAIEVLRDKAIALPPIDSAIASQMIASTRIARLLAGYRDVAAADVQAIESVLLALSDMAMALPGISELDINPLLANAEGVIALDARVVLSP